MVKRRQGIHPAVLGDLTGEPVLSRLSRKFDIEFNIRAGGVRTCMAQLSAL